MARRTDSDETDTKLHVERERSNDELLERSTALGEDADGVIRKARERAAAVLELARHREDALSSTSGVSPELARERSYADEALELEHRLADAALGDERSRRLRALIQLLATERDATDQALSSERRAYLETLSARDDVLAGMQHDTRGVLSILMLNASLITTRSSDPEIIAMANGMLRATAQMDSLLADLLDVTTMESGKLVVRTEQADLVSVVRNAFELNTLAARTHSIDLRLDAPRTPVVVPLDERRMMRVLMNLLANAIKFVPDNGHVTISVKRLGREVEVAVADTGPGVPPGDLESIFDRFQRTDLANRKPGYGLGLYIARGIVAAHGGRIWAVNNPSGGATFAFRLPADEP